MRTLNRGALIAAVGLTASLGAGFTAGAAPAEAIPAVGAGTPGWRVEAGFGECANGEVLSVTATGPANAWAAGYYVPTCGVMPDPEVPLVARWNGRSWRALPLPARFNTGQSGGAAAVATLSGSYAWTFAGIAGPKGGSYALLRTDDRWRTFTLAHESGIESAVAFSRTNVWAFGSVGSVAPGAPYAVRFNGKTWRRVPIPVAAQATADPGPSNIWAVGTSANSPAYPLTFALAHWTGRWTTYPFPNLHLPSGQSLMQAWVVSDGAGGAWIAANITDKSFADPVAGVLLHRTSHGWKTVALPVQVDGLGPLGHDGHGGLWITSTPAMAQGTDPFDNIEMLHYAAGAWKGTVVTVEGLGVNAMRLIPGTNASLWAGGYVAGGDIGEDISSAILKYGP